MVSKVRQMTFCNVKLLVDLKKTKLFDKKPSLKHSSSVVDFSSDAGKSSNVKKVLRHLKCVISD
jgi:hypothetical protein